MTSHHQSLEKALRDAARAVRQGRPDEPITVDAGALWLLQKVLYEQDEQLEKLRGKRGQNR